MDQHQSLRKIPNPDRGGFVIAPDGAYIHWPKPDVHLDLEDTRLHDRQNSVRPTGGRMACSGMITPLGRDGTRPASHGLQSSP